MIMHPLAGDISLSLGVEQNHGENLRLKGPSTSAHSRQDKAHQDCVDTPALTGAQYSR